MIPYGHQQITQSDIDAVIAVLQSDFLTQGPMVPRFEHAVVARCGAKYGVAVNSATSALHLACLVLELGPQDFLWTVPNTFVASANCGRYCGATVDFVDIEGGTWNICTQALHEKLIRAKKSGKLPKVVVAVHFGGQPPDLERIWELAQEFGFKVIEDASHSIGSARNNEKTGSCRWSDITVFSFHPVKVITTGEGGMAVTNSPKLARRMELLRSHGVTRDAAYMQNESRGSWYYEQIALGFNYRMTDIQAALGLSQMVRLDAFVKERNSLAIRYKELLHDLPVHLTQVKQENISAYHLYPVCLTGEAAVSNHKKTFDCLRDQGVGVNLHYMPVHLQPYYRAMGFKEGMFPEAEKYASVSISLPLYVGLTEDEQIYVAHAVAKAIA